METCRDDSIITHVQQRHHLGQKKKNERKREDEGQDGREMVSEGGGKERLQLEVFATNVNISREHDVELFITDVKSRISVDCSI